jgi:predicted ATPase with chaperone activity
VPDSNAAEAAVAEELEVIPVSSLAEAAAFFAGHLDIDPVPSRLQELFNTLSRYDDDYSDVRGQELAKRALVIAAAGAHNLLMLGPPGSGKTEYIPRHRTLDPAAAFRRGASWRMQTGVPRTYDSVDLAARRHTDSNSDLLCRHLKATEKAQTELDQCQRCTMRSLNDSAVIEWMKAARRRIFSPIE